MLIFHACSQMYLLFSLSCFPQMVDQILKGERASSPEVIAVVRFRWKGHHPKVARMPPEADKPCDFSVAPKKRSKVFNAVLWVHVIHKWFAWMPIFLLRDASHSCGAFGTFATSNSAPNNRCRMNEVDCRVSFRVCRV